MSRPAKPLAQRFAQKWRRDASTGCWNWAAYIDALGYGTIRVGATMQRAHRVAWVLHNGDPGDMDVCHRCDNRKCVNPDHLFLGTHNDNMRDAAQKERFPLKLSPASVKLAVALVAAGVSQTDVARRFGCSQPYISRLVSGQRRHLLLATTTN